MTISDKSWKEYISDLRKLSKKAAELMSVYLQTHEYKSKAGRKAAINYGYALATKYGEGAAERSCQMYDAVAVASKKRVPPAVPAKTATYKETAKSIYGTMAYSKNTDLIGSSVGNLVKMAGVDTTMQNALRDGAEWAWVPFGDTCPFCLTLASRGWQKASKKAIKNGHADHIHRHCDCTYAIRFDGKSTVEGYDPDAYLDQYYAAEGDTPSAKINYMRRQNYAANREKINAQKREAYAKRVSAKEVDKGVGNGILKSHTTVSGHEGTPKKAKPGSVIDHIGKDGKVETRTYYGDSGFKSKDITNHNHGKPKQHPYGKHGEHAHDYEWNEDGTPKKRTTREITDKERKENGDIL